MERLRIGMTQDEVVAAIGHEPFAAVGATRDGEHVVEVWKYVEATANPWPDMERIRAAYYLYFFNGELDRWSDHGDWEREAGEVLEVRLR